MSDDAATPALPERTDLWQETLHWQPNAEQQKKFQRLYEQILAGNRQFNLTRITEPSEFWEKHLWDSLAGILKTPQDVLAPVAAIDIGTGAGFPGLPIAIACPQWTVTLLDATRKKIAFLETLLPVLELANVKTLCDRVEQVGQQLDYREQYDLALVRAVAPASVCAEYALPLLKCGGTAMLYRGQWTEAEAEALARAVSQLGGTIAAVKAFNTPVSHSQRHLLYLHKTAATPTEFPRPVGIPSQRSL
jgi:16S rRNA (guanine527-N7)-methyltransferase